MFVDASWIDLDQRPRELQERLGELSSGADRAIEVEVRDRLPEFVEAELASKLERIESVQAAEPVAQAA